MAAVALPLMAVSAGVSIVSGISQMRNANKMYKAQVPLVGQSFALQREMLGIQKEMAGLAFEGDKMAAEAQLFSAQAASDAYSAEATMMELDAAYKMSDQLERAEYVVRDNKRFAGSQSVTMLKNGVDLAGTPLLILDETREEGIKEAQSILDNVDRTAELSKLQVEQHRRTGRSALIGGQMQANVSMFQAGLRKAGTILDASFSERRARIDRDTQLANLKGNRNSNMFTGIGTLANGFGQLANIAGR